MALGGIHIPLAGCGCFWCFRTGPALAQHHCWLLLVFQNWPCPGSTSLLAASGVSELALPWLNITAGCFWCFRTGPALAQHHCWLLLVFQNWPRPGSTSLLAASGVSELALPWLNITAGCFWCFRTGPALAQHHCWLLLVFQVNNTCGTSCQLICGCRP